MIENTIIEAFFGQNLIGLARHRSKDFGAKLDNQEILTPNKTESKVDFDWLKTVDAIFSDASQHFLKKNNLELLIKEHLGFSEKEFIKLPSVLKATYQTSIDTFQKVLGNIIEELNGLDHFQLKTDQYDLWVNAETLQIWLLSMRVQAKRDIDGLDLKIFRLPSVEELSAFKDCSTNPFITDKNRFCEDYRRWLSSEGGVDLDYMKPDGRKTGNIALIAHVNDFLKSKESFLESVITLLLEGYWTIKGVLIKNRLHELIKEAKNMNFDQFFTDVDSYSAPLPELSQDDLLDPEKGLWELWGTDADKLKNFNTRARNPVEDIKKWPVAIDFGTSSTVVAYQEEGRKKLLRIGVKDFYQSAIAKHYENPTLLNFKDFAFLDQAWQRTAYRPRVPWSEVKCSHEALENLRDNEGDTNVTASTLSKIKHWALKQGHSKPTKLKAFLSDQEIELPNLTLRMPVKGQALSVGKEDPFDPVELYAWFLGMMINWRGRGLFLKYYMSFPVAYPREVKEKILASFQRGLQRSLPETLVSQPEFEQFEVVETASEPTALAASTLPALGIEPTEEGVAYAIFDFGGGTTDFDFGIYRYATNEEESKEGIEEVFEHFGASGDRYLGGENLLENLAYLVFKANHDICRQNEVVFTKPMDAHDFPGSEIFIQNTLAAQTNTQMVMAKLRSFWEEAEEISSGVISIELINRNAELVRCGLTLDYDALNDFLRNRIGEGIQNFFTAMEKGFFEQGITPDLVHVVLAGNASHSRYIDTSFNLYNKQDAEDDEDHTPSLCDELAEFVKNRFKGQVPEFQIYPPIEKSEHEDKLFSPNAKTAVALGLLEFRPGSPVRVINRTHTASQGEALFNFYVGRIRRRKFNPLIKRGAVYLKWHEVGIVRDNTFELAFSHSPQANTEEMPADHKSLSYCPLTLAGKCDGHKLFARVIGPDSIEYCTAENQSTLDASQYENLAKLQLK